MYFAKLYKKTNRFSQCTPEFVESLYKENVCDVVRHNYFVKRTDIKVAVPLHYHKNNPISKVLYGYGGVQYIGIKKYLIIRSQ